MFGDLFALEDENADVADVVQSQQSAFYRSKARN
jgi:hypothetical protein